MDVTALLAMIDAYYPNAETSATKVSSMNTVLHNLSAKKYGLLVEDISLITVEDQEAYSFPDGLTDVYYMDFMGIGTEFPYQARTIICTHAATGTGTITLVVTAAGMTGSPVSVALEVTIGDTASEVADLVRTALEDNAQVAAFFTISGSGANVIITAIDNVADDSTMDIAFTDTDTTGVTFGSDADSTLTSRDDYLKYDIGYADDLPRYGQYYFQKVTSAGVKSLAIYPVPSTSGYRIMLRFYKTIPDLSADTVTGVPEIDSNFHEMLVYYAIHQLAAAGDSMNADQANLYMQKYENMRRDFIMMMQSRQHSTANDRRDNNHWNRRAY